MSGNVFEEEEQADLVEMCRKRRDPRPLRRIPCTNILYAPKSLLLQPTVHDYYNSLESRLGYWLLLRNSRHCGLYKNGQQSPFPIAKAQRAMEEKLFSRLGLPPGSTVLDAGMGSGQVAISMARRGLRVHGVDIELRHLSQAYKNIIKAGLQEKISVQFADYHNLSNLTDASFDAVYTMETFAHADDPSKALAEFYRVLKPGGVIVMHEGDFNRNSPLLQEVLRLSHCVGFLHERSFQRLLTDAGFHDYSVEDLTDQVYPLWRLFGTLGYVPYQFLKLFHMQYKFVNVMAGVETWKHWGEGRYVSVKAVKPLPRIGPH